MPGKELREAFWKYTENLSSLEQNWKKNAVAAIPLSSNTICQERCDGA